MSLTTKERSLLDGAGVFALSPVEYDYVQDTMAFVMDDADQVGVRLANDDRMASFEAALIKFVVESRRAA